MLGARGAVSINEFTSCLLVGIKWRGFKTGDNFMAK